VTSTESHPCCFIFSLQGTARKIGQWDDEEAAALTRAVQEYMDSKQAVRAARQVGRTFAHCLFGD